MELNPAAGWLLRVRDVLCHGTLEKCPLDTIAGTLFDAAESGPPPLHSVRCPDHFCLESFPQELKVRRSKMH